MNSWNQVSVCKQLDSAFLSVSSWNDIADNDADMQNVAQPGEPGNYCLYKDSLLFSCSSNQEGKSLNSAHNHKPQQ